MFTVGVPFLFYTITHRHTEFYDDLDIYQLSAADRNAGCARRCARGASRSAPRRRSSRRSSEDMAAARVQIAVRNRAKNLYCFFKYQLALLEADPLGEVPHRRRRRPEDVFSTRRSRRR